MHRLTAIVVVATLALAGGCGKKASEKAVEKMVETQTGAKAKVDLDDQGMRVEGKDGAMTLETGKHAKLPDNFPKDVYVLDGATVDMAMKMPQGQSIALSSKKSVTEVAESYKKKMVAEGWTQKASMDMGEQLMLVYEKEGRAANVIIAGSKEEKLTRINLTVAMQ